jgi:hypothetical protein
VSFLNLGFGSSCCPAPGRGGSVSELALAETSVAISRSESHPIANDVYATFARRAKGEWPNADAGVFVPGQKLTEAVVLQGRVPNYYEKQLAQAIAQQVTANRHVVKVIEVVFCR